MDCVLTRKIRSQGQRFYWHVFDGLWVETENTKIVNRISIHWVYVALLMVVKYAVAPEWPSANNMSIRENVSFLGVYDKASRFT